MTDLIKHYVVLKTTADARGAYSTGSVKEVLGYVAKWIFPGIPMFNLPARVTALPSNEVGLALAALASKAAQEGVQGGELTARFANGELDGLVVALDVDNEETVEKIEAVVAKLRDIFSGSSPDLPFAHADHWCPREAADPIFADRSAAERLLGVDYLRGKNGTTGQGVNVVIVDFGLDASALGRNYIAGWPVGSKLPGTTLREPGSPRRSHGMMIAHNILKIAPDVGFFDLPLLPPRITDIPVFLSLADAAFRKMLTGIAVYQNGGRPGPWILVNPWAIFDTSSDPRGKYTNDPNSSFNKLVADAVKQNIDVVFGAGNCGQFCPDIRCGATDRGPGRSIWGANCLEEVVTVGAVRADTLWLGYSSQGPGQSNLAHDKPDLCAPSQFCEDDDAFTVNTGTSAACALAAGAVAALRSEPKMAALSPAEMKALLIKTARKTAGPKWNERLGHGILDVRAAYDEGVKPVV